MAAGELGAIGLTTSRTMPPSSNQDSTLTGSLAPVGGIDGIGDQFAEGDGELTGDLVVHLRLLEP